MEIAIYFEGGGDSKDSKEALRQGMHAFLKPLVDLARQHRYRWTTIPCGGRNQTWNAFNDAVKKDPGKFNILLVDSETGVKTSPLAHLQNGDGWHLRGIKEDRVHLMAQCMETWFVADAAALADYYGQGFLQNALPRRINLEEEPKTQVHAALESATRQTQKGSYGKIKHASQLLKRVSQEKAKTRCHHCSRLFKVVEAKIQS